VPAVNSTHRWQLPKEPDAAVADLALRLALPELAVRVLMHRGLSDAESVQSLLNPSAARLNKPDLLPDIKPATERITAALERKERILVYGDYDVDGVTATAVLVTTLRRLGADVLYYLPARETEGYGLSEAGVRFAGEHGVKLMVTVDCGSTDHEDVRLANELGIDVIITDHHEVPDVLPESLALVNPKRPGSAYPFSELAGVGVAFKLAWSLLAALDRPKQELTDLLDLVGVGTIADMVPLVDENRIIARLGLTALGHTTRPGLAALMELAGIGKRPPTSYDVGFVIGPRLNAAGRLKHARTAVELLLTEDPAEGKSLARELDTLNRERQSVEERITNQALTIVEAARLFEDRVLVLAAEGWHKGVIGVVASKVVERYYRPCVVIALDGETGKGSARSISGFNLYESLAGCRELLLGFGGHKYAAGLSISRDKVRDFTRAINQYAASVPDEVYQPSLQIDAVCGLEEVDDRLVQFLRQLEPFGPENRKPVLATLGVEVIGYPRRVGKNHLKLTLRAGDTAIEAMAWGRSAELPNIEVGRRDHLDICYTVDQRTYAGRTSTQLNLRDLRSR